MPGALFGRCRVHWVLKEALVRFRGEVTITQALLDCALEHLRPPTQKVAAEKSGLLDELVASASDNAY